MNKTFQNISKHFKTSSKHFIKLASFFHDRSDLNDKTDFVFSRISQSIMGLPHGVSPITFFCVHNISLYIQISSVHNTDTPFILKYRQTPIVCCFSLYLCIFKSTFFMYIHLFLVHIKYFSYKTFICT